MQIRKATEKDIDAIAAIYEKTHTAEESGRAAIGWIRGIYPERETALAALERNDLFIIEDAHHAVGTGIINKIQVDVYAKGNWKYQADASVVMVLHTLVIDPEMEGKGYGKRFVQFYEKFAAQNACPCLRIDTNEKMSGPEAFTSTLAMMKLALCRAISTV